MSNFIENVSRSDIRTGMHSDAGPNSMLIQISDIISEHPAPLKAFKEIHQFNFEDIEEDEEWACTDTQAAELASLLRHAMNNHMNVIVHCHAGLCRSGAVVEAGIFIGFNPPDRLRLPNTLVKNKLFKALGVQINESTSVWSS